MKKMIIIVTVPVVLETWLKGQPKFLSRYYDVEIITSNASNIKDIEKYEGVNIKLVDFNRDINVFKDLKILIQLLFYFLKVKPTFVYTLTPKAGLLGMLASWMAQVPYRVHNVVGLPLLEATGNRKILLEATEKITYFCSTNLYCNSKVLRNVVSVLSKKKVDVIANGSVNGVDTKLFQDTFSDNKKNELRKSLGFEKNNFIITYVGRIVNDKGINELIEAFQVLSNNFEDVKLLLIGDYINEHDSISKESIELLKNNKAITHLEFQEDVGKYFSISSLFVLPSYREGLPNVLIEAGSYGLPLIATDINGCNEVIEHNLNGLLIEKKNSRALLEAIERFILDSEFYAYVKVNVRKSIVEKYDQTYFWCELRKEFKQIKDNE